MPKIENVSKRFDINQNNFFPQFNFAVYLFVHIKQFVKSVYS